MDRAQVNRTIYQLDLLYKQLSPQEFGRVMQQLLASVFEAVDFRVIENAVGVPDFTAAPTAIDSESRTFAVEVKTGDKSKIVLTQRDLDGVRTPGQIGVVAILEFPAHTPRWLLVPEHRVSPRSWEMRHLTMMDQVNVGFDVNWVFHRIVNCLEATSVPSGLELEGWIRTQRHNFHASNNQGRASLTGEPGTTLRPPRTELHS